MKEKDIISKLKEKGFTVKKVKENHSIHNKKVFIGAVKIKNDFPNILFDNEEKLLENLFSEWGLTQKPIDFNKGDLW